MAAEVCEEYLQQPRLARLYYEMSLEQRPTQPELIEKLHGKDARERYEARARQIAEELTEKYYPVGRLPGVADVGPGSVPGLFEVN